MYLDIKAEHLMGQPLSCLGCLSLLPFCAYAAAFVCLDIAETEKDFLWS